MLQTLTTVNMRAATTVITDRDTKSKILVMETDYMPAPILGKTTFLSKYNEEYIKSRFNKLYFSNNIQKSHPLKYLLGLHTKLTESWELDNECSIDLLERILKGDAFQRIHTYLKIERSISRCYQVLQSIYSDELSPSQAQNALDKYMKNPSAHDPPHNTIEEVFLHIHLLCSRIHALEMDPAKQQNTLSSAFSAIRWYLQANFVEREVKQLYLDFDEHMNDHKHMMNTSYAFWILKSLTKRRFLATLPRHQLQKQMNNQPIPPNGGFKHKQITHSLRPMGKMEEILSEEQDNSMQMEEVNMENLQITDNSQSYEESDEEDEATQWANAYVEANPDECMFMYDEGVAEEIQNSDISNEVLEINPPAFDKMNFRDYMRCRLCGCNATEAHTPPFFRSCTFFRGQLPQKIQQQCCGGFHAVISHGTTCPVVQKLGPRTVRPVYNRPQFRGNPPNRNRFGGQRPNQPGQPGRYPQYQQPGQQTQQNFQLAQRPAQNPQYNQPPRQVY
jgi:hypothetical protein